MGGGLGANPNAGMNLGEMAAKGGLIHAAGGGCISDDMPNICTPQPMDMNYCNATCCMVMCCDKGYMQHFGCVYQPTVCMNQNPCTYYSQCIGPQDCDIGYMQNQMSGCCMMPDNPVCGCGFGPPNICVSCATPTPSTYSRMNSPQMNACSGDYNPMQVGYQCQMMMNSGLGGICTVGFAKGGSSKDCCTDCKCWVKTLNKGLKCAEPDFKCSACTMLRSQTNANLGNITLHSLRQMKCGIAGSADGGLAHAYKAAAPKGHNPEFITGVTGYYACGGGTGQSDDIPAMLHDGDYVMDAETVSALGDGSSKAGRHVLEGFRKQLPHKETVGSNPVPAKIADGEYVFPAAFVTALGGGDNKKGSEILDGLRKKLRDHKRSAPLDSIPPKAKTPIDYIKKGKK